MVVNPKLLNPKLLGAAEATRDDVLQQLFGHHILIEKLG